MRDQYYGDRKDVWKWTVVRREAQDAQATRILYVAMMRPDGNADANHGGSFDPVAGSDATIVQFFAQERQAFGLQAFDRPADWHIAYPQNRRVRRIVRLRQTLSRSVTYVGAEYRADHAQTYFDEQVMPWLGQNVTAVVLLDPDTCMVAEPDDRQVGTAQVEAVWQAMSTGSTLVLYLEPNHQQDAMNAQAAQLAGLLQIAPAQVRMYGFPFAGGSGFLAATRP